MIPLTKSRFLFIILTIFGLFLILLSYLFQGRNDSNSIFPNILSNIAIAFLISGIVGYVFQFVGSDLIEKVENTLANEIEGTKSTLLSGIEKVYDSPSQALADYSSIVERTKDRVEILSATSTPFFWSPDFERATINALKRGVKFRILLLDPKAKSLNLLSRQEGQDSEDFSAELRLTLRRWRDLEKKARNFTRPESIEVRTYDELPSTFLLMTDDVLFFAPYLYSSYRISSPCIQIKSSGSIAHSLKEHFNSMWELAHEAHVVKD